MKFIEGFENWQKLRKMKKEEYTNILYYKDSEEYTNKLYYKDLKEIEYRINSLFVDN